MVWNAIGFAMWASLTAPGFALRAGEGFRNIRLA
jgi:hypothetical protein